MRFNDLNISTKLMSAFSLVVGVFVLSSVMLNLSLGANLDAARQNNTSYQNSRAVDGMLASAVEQQNALRAYLLTGAQEHLDSYAKHGAAADKHIVDFSAKTALPEQRERAAKLQEALTEWRTQQAEPQIAMMADPATQEGARALTGKVRLTKVRQLHGELTAAQQELVAERWTIQQKTIADAKRALVVGAVIAALAAVALGWLLTRTIGGPVALMTQAMKRLAGGDNAVEVPAVGRKDEVGEMAQAVLAFKEAAIAKLRAEADAAEHRTAAEGERARNADMQAKAARELGVVVEALAQGLSRLSAGDLTARVSVGVAPEYEPLKRDFNAAMQKLQETMEVIVGTVGAIGSGAAEISTAADSLSKRTENQAAGLEETAAALDQITATVKRAADGAEHARTVVATAQGDAERSRDVVSRAVEAMSHIEKSAKEISQIIGVIDEIAFQTNLLALNAGVEAARAGDAGRGFAVVASEVRALAQRSAEAAKEIKALITTSTENVAEGVQLVGETGEALQRIAGQVGEINGVVVEIAASAQEQAVGLNQVNTAVNQMDQLTQQNAAMVEESTAASRGLAGEAGELRRLMAQFQVGQTAAPGRAPAPAAPVGGASVRRMPASGAATARKLAPVAEEDGWEEF